MAEDKEKSLTDETLPQEPEEKSDGWDWDAAVPQTDTTNITFDDLQEILNALHHFAHAPFMSTLRQRILRYRI